MTGMCPFFTYLSLAIGQIKPQRSFKAEGVALPLRRGAERRRRSTASRSVALLLLRALCALLCIFHVPFFLVEDTPDLSAPTCAAAQLWMNYCVSRRGITLAVLLGSQSRYYFHAASLLIVCGLIGPLAVTTTTPSVVRMAFALPTACAYATQHQQQQRQNPQPHHCPSHRHKRRKRRRPPMSHILNAAASVAAAAAAAGPVGDTAGGSSSKGANPPAAAATAAATAAPPTVTAAAAAAPSLEVLKAARRESAGSGLEVDGVHMRRALELAAKGLGRTRPNPAVGCVILDKNGLVVGEGFHPRAGEPHAEVWAIRQAGERARGGTAYVTLEPCNHFGRTPPCTTALLDCGISRVVAGMVDPDPRTAGSGLRRLADAGIDVVVGVEGAACQALNSAFVHRVSQKSCYGVLHCSLGEGAANSDSLEGLEDSSEATEAKLTVPPDGKNYEAYDAIVVEGRSGVAKLAASLSALPPTALRVVIVGVGSDEGLEAELGGLLESPLWTDSPERTIVFGPAIASREGTPSPRPGSVRASLEARGVTIVDFPLPTAPPSLGEGQVSTMAALEMAAAATAVSRELYRRGMLSAAWEVGPAMATIAIGAGHIQRALVRRRSRGGGTGVGEGGAAAAAASAGGGQELPDLHGMDGDEDVSQEEGSVLRAMKRLSGREGAYVRRGGGSFPWRASAESCIEVLLPPVELDHPGST